jgi:rubrerythrin
MPPQQMRAFAPDSHLNSLFLADLLSAFLAHERCGVHLYRSAIAQTHNEAWRQRYQAFLGETEEHVRILESLVSQLGGDPMYVSPAARLDELQNAKLMEPILLAGSFDSITSELAGLEAVLIAEQKCHANWSLLSRLVQGLADGESVRVLRQAVNQVESQEDEHVRWALSTWQQTLMTLLQAA